MLSYPAFSRAKAVPKTGPLRVYGVLGDAYLQQQVIASLLEWTLAADARDFNLDTVDGETATVTDVLARAGNLPFLSDYRGVLVQRAERLEGMNRGGEEKESAAKGRQTPVKHLAAGIEHLPATTVLILARTPETPEPGARAGAARCVHATVDKVIEKHGVIIDCTVGPRDTGRAVAIINHEAAQRHMPLADGAAEHLVRRGGCDLAHLLNELEKCALRAGIGNLVTCTIIDEMTKRAPQDTIFDLTDALGERRVPRALGLMRELIEGGEAPELMLVMLVRHFRQLLQARTFLDARLPLDASLNSRLPRELAAQLPQDGRDNLAVLLQSQHWLGRRLAQQARNFSVPQLQGALQAALAVDLAIKGIEGEGGTPELLLDLLVAQLG